MPLGRQSLYGVQLRKVGCELGVQLSSRGDFSGQLDFAAAWDQGLGVPDDNRVPADRSPDMVQLHRRVRRVPCISSDGGDIPLIRLPQCRRQLGPDELAGLPVVRFPMKIRRGYVQLFDPEVGREKIWEIRALQLLCRSGWWRRGGRCFFSDYRFQFFRTDMVDYPFAFQKLRPVEVRSNIDDAKGSQFAFGRS